MSYPYNFRAGDTVRITSCINGHKFKLNQVVVIDRVDESDRYTTYKATDGNDWWWFGDSECVAASINSIKYKPKRGAKCITE